MERLPMSDRLRIMILEDDHHRINSFKTILELQVQDVSYHLTADSFIKALSKEKFVDCIMLDHDLGGKTYVDTGDRNTGSEVVRYILKNKDDEKFKKTKIVVHTFNTSAGKLMTDTLRHNNFDVIFVPGIWMKETFRQYIKMDVQ